jgi:hypothetical protein
MIASLVFVDTNLNLLGTQLLKIILLDLCHRLQSLPLSEIGQLLSLLLTLVASV